ncbi:MAG: hypothetical protein ACJA1Z_000035 [Patiriisocius sp.]|jgi:hypothetical protein
MNRKQDNKLKSFPQRLKIINEIKQLFSTSRGRAYPEFISGGVSVFI